MAKNKLSFFERLTGSIHIADDFDDAPAPKTHARGGSSIRSASHVREAPAEVSEEEAATAENPSWATVDAEEGELPIDMYQTPQEVIIRAMIAGVRPEDLEISITREMVVVRGRRQEHHESAGHDFFHQELYWGAFSRTILLPHEVEPEEAEAIEKHGLLTIRIPKINKEKKASLKVKSI